MPIDFERLLVTGVERGASDFHLKAGAPPILRIHGRLIPQGDFGVITADDMDGLARRMLAERWYNQLRDGKEIDSAYSIPNFGRFRVNMFLALGAVRAVLRAVPANKPRFDELGLPPVLEQLAMERRGLVLCTGITGSGKSTTLAAMIDFINRNRNDHIITIEDPIEFTHEDINCVISQREIGHDSASFAIALRAALREDPDVILLGEMRDPETMSVALHAAETGHLVFSTLHTLNAGETVNRIIGTFPPHQEQQIRDQLAAVIEGVISQRLVPRIGGEGRVPAVEVMIGTGLIRDCIREAKRTPDIPAAIAQGQVQYGMQTFDQCLLRLYREGLVSCSGRQPLLQTIVAAKRLLDAAAARLTAADLLSRRAWTRRELTRRLERRGAPASVASEVVADLAGRGDVDDAAFARQWVEVRAARGYGPARLRAELRARGVAPSLIDAALPAVTREAQLARARAVARRRLPALRRRDPVRAAARLRDFLRRRGYPASVVVRVLRESTGLSVED